MYMKFWKYILLLFWSTATEWCFKTTSYLLILQVGNPLTDDFYDSKGLLEYAWSHSVISDDQFNKTKEVCDFKALFWPTECVTAMNVVYGKYKEIDFYNIYAPICLSNSTSSSQAYFGNKVSHLFAFFQSLRIKVDLRLSELTTF